MQQAPPANRPVRGSNSIRSFSRFPAPDSTVYSPLKCAPDSANASREDPRRNGHIGAQSQNKFEYLHGIVRIFADATHDFCWCGRGGEFDVHIVTDSVIQSFVCAGEWTAQSYPPVATSAGSNRVFIEHRLPSICLCAVDHRTLKMPAPWWAAKCTNRFHW